jgi:hypothetical protein
MSKFSGAENFSAFYGRQFFNYWRHFVGSLWEEIFQLFKSQDNP